MEGQLNNSTLREAEAETETRRLQKINTMLEEFKAREELRAGEMKTVVWGWRKSQRERMTGTAQRCAGKTVMVVSSSIIMKATRPHSGSEHRVSSDNRTKCTHL